MTLGQIHYECSTEVVPQLKTGVDQMLKLAGILYRAAYLGWVVELLQWRSSRSVLAHWRVTLSDRFH